MREFGRVVDWSRTFGFIAPDRGGRDVFFAGREVLDALRDLPIGARVSFSRGMDRDARPCAQRVQLEDG